MSPTSLEGLRMAGAGEVSSATGMLFRIDYLAVTVHRTKASALQHELQAVLGEEWGQGDKGWELLMKTEAESKWTGPLGAYIEENRCQNWVHFAIKGKACSELGTRNVLEVAGRLVGTFGRECRFTRIDVAWDDFTRAVLPEEFGARAWNRAAKSWLPEVVSRARQGRFVLGVGDDQGQSFYVGARSSERLLRVYDKRAESEGRIDCIRFELEVHRKVADALMREMRKSEDPVGVAARYLVGFVDFRKVSVRKGRAVRGARCGWWARIVGDARAARLATGEEPLLEDYLREFTRQAGSRFAVLLAYHGEDLASAAKQLVVDPSRIRNRRVRRLIATARGIAERGQAPGERG